MLRSTFTARRWTNFWRRPLADKWLLLQAYILLGIARLAINTIAFKRLARLMGQHMQASSSELTNDQVEQSRRVSWAIQRASRFTPWNSNCLPQAMVAQYLLSRRGIPTTLYLGVMLNEAQSMKAHAWTRCGRRIVTGRNGHRQFGVVATFRK